MFSNNLQTSISAGAIQCGSIHAILQKFIEDAFKQHISSGATVVAYLATTNWFLSSHIQRTQLQKQKLENKNILKTDIVRDIDYTVEVCLALHANVAMKVCCVERMISCKLPTIEADVVCWRYPGDGIFC